VTMLCDYGRRELDAPEIALKSATVWTVRDGRIVRAEFYAGGRAEALQAVGLAGKCLRPHQATTADHDFLRLKTPSLKLASDVRAWPIARPPASIADSRVGSAAQRLPS
jgi:hypothetical protein